MDLTLVDVTGIPGIAVGDEVILLGTSDGLSVDALEHAEISEHYGLRNSLQHFQTRAAKVRELIAHHPARRGCFPLKPQISEHQPQMVTVE